MTGLLALAFWSIVGGAFALLLLAALATALIWRDWHRDGGHW